jgi:hypothetical protein
MIWTMDRWSFSRKTGRSTGVRIKNQWLDLANAQLRKNRLGISQGDFCFLSRVR